MIIERLNVQGVFDVQAIPKSTEKFMAVAINKFYTLCDSMSFLSGSLDALVKTLPEDHPFEILKQSSLVKRLKTDEEYHILFEKWKYRK